MAICITAAFHNACNKRDDTRRRPAISAAAYETRLVPLRPPSSNSRRQDLSGCPSRRNGTQALTVHLPHLRREANAPNERFRFKTAALLC